VAAARTAVPPNDRKRRRVTVRTVTARTRAAETLEATQRGKFCNRISTARLGAAETLKLHSSEEKLIELQLQYLKQGHLQNTLNTREFLHYFDCKRKINHCCVYGRITKILV
jgi:hypothetical protein